LIALAQVVLLLGFPLGSALTAIGRPENALRVNGIATVVLLPVLIGLLYSVGLAGAGLHAAALSLAKVGGLTTALWGVRRETIREAPRSGE